MSRISVRDWEEMMSAVKLFGSIDIAGPWTLGADGNWTRVTGEGGRVVAVVREQPDEVADLRGGGHVVLTDLVILGQGRKPNGLQGRYPVMDRADADDVLIRIGYTLVGP
jgi:hypothetical protein